MTIRQRDSPVRNDGRGLKLDGLPRPGGDGGIRPSGMTGVD